MTAKLVRDYIPKIIQKTGRKTVFHIASDEEFVRSLLDKLRKECEEFIESRKPEELADILEVVYAHSDILGISREEIERIRQKKEKERRSFKNRIILEQ